MGTKYKNERKIFIAIDDKNTIVANSRTGKDFADQLHYFGKSHIWYSRKFKDKNTFTHLFDNRVFWLYKIYV